jgi:hypothetical protein
LAQPDFLSTSKNNHARDSVAVDERAVGGLQVLDSGPGSGDPKNRVVLRRLIIVEDEPTVGSTTDGERIVERDGARFARRKPNSNKHWQPLPVLANSDNSR